MTMINEDNSQSSLRQHMIDGQLLPNDVTDENVVEAVSKVNRETFMPDNYKGVAYLDKSIQVAPGRYILEPLVFAKLLSSAEIQKNELALDIAPATGYSSAVISKMVEAVVSIEEDKTLSEIATQNLSQEECDNVAVINAPHKEGLAKQGPYDLIFINGMVDEIPETLLNQLKDNGRLLCILNQDGFGRAVLVTYIDKIVGIRILFDAIAPALPGFQKPKKFEF